ncbi:efflux RND transporter periplasmic adaptor subunit [Chiayiivirga flava]|uniref:Membrane fusion protein (Multidrug efflux system) n=1 Tax=Chiayiivirga flava TaxID=659595 RepID=A0A7W8G083_9GAMM|nr:efflux RND transporter periplasmic adaptor subunit [Chiayiivirga flava]MBB5208911.1 membrane fusion protein (multidrug efflux system) [Chiayiivirga flava]
MPQSRRFHVPALVFVTLATLFGCSRQEAPRGATSPPVVVTSALVETKPWRDTIEALGTAQAKESVTLTAKVTETVNSVNFEDGDLVEAGRVLVDLSGRAEVAQLREAQAAYTEAQQQYARQSELVTKGTIARSQLDTQIATRDAAKARADAIRAALSDRVITAPFAGVLGFRQVSQGALVTPGAVIATLDDVSTIKLDFSIPEAYLGAVQVGQQVTAHSPAYPEREFAGTVAAIDSRVDPVTRAVTVRAEIPNPEARLRPGMLLTVRLFRPERQAIVIPEIALVQVGTNAFVYRIDDAAKASQVNVRVGARRRGEIEIVEGLAVGDRIVIDGTGKLRDGATVQDAARAPAAAEPPAAAPSATAG